MKDLTEQIYDELSAQVVRMLNHSLNQASRIVELETQLKDHSAQAFSIGETYANALSRIAELEAQIAAASAPADTEKLRELRARIYEMKEAAYTYGDNSKEAVCAALDGVLDEIDEVASTALQAPVREVPEVIYQMQHRSAKTVWTDIDAYAYQTAIAGGGAERVRKVLPLPAAPVQQEGE